jgi:alginate O-acetyltransferase complex protein AlgI
MHFLSVTWLTWMMATVCLYWITPMAWRFRLLVLITAVFLLVYAPLSAAILTALTIFTYALSRKPELSGYRILAIGSVIVAIVGFYKIQVTGNTIDTVFEQGLIPLGLSYYSFRCLHYLLERYKGTIHSATFEEFVSYLFFLPTIVVGPIHRFGQFQQDYHRIRWNAELISEGMERILYGYVKIAFLGNFLVGTKLGNYIQGFDSQDTVLIAYLEMVRGGFSLYFQFSGFADIAIGFSRLLGFRVMENFNWPYLQKNISDYWRCWHISLTSWCRDYVYTSVVSLSRSPALGAIATLLVIGLWHEISLRYLAWGFYHGLGIVLWQQFQRVKPVLPKIQGPVIRKLVDAASILVTVHFVWFGLIIARQPDFSSVLEVWNILLTGWW